MRAKKIEEILTSRNYFGWIKILLKNGKEFKYNDASDDEAIIEDGDTLKLTTEIELNKFQIIYIDCADISAIYFETT